MALGDALVFAEVKAHARPGASALAATPAKWRRVGLAAGRFLAARDVPGDTALRFDLVLVSDGRTEVIENALVEGLA